MPNTLSEQTLDQITSSNAKAAADMSLTAMHLATQNSVANQGRMQDIFAASYQNSLTIAQNAMQNGLMIAQAAATQATKRILDASIENAVADTKLLGADLADKLQNLGSALAGVQQDIKAAQSTGPETGPGGMTGLLEQLAANAAVQAQQLGAMNTILQNLAATSKAA